MFNKEAIGAIGATVLLVKLGLDPGGILDRFGEDGLGFGRDAISSGG